MAVRFRIDQNGIQGEPGKSRTDLAAGAPITLVALEPVGATFEWELVDRVGSDKALSATSGATVTIAAPTSGPCTFHIEMRAFVDGQLAGPPVRRIAAVRSPVRGLRAVAFAETAGAGSSLAAPDVDASTDNAHYSDLAGTGLAGDNARGYVQWAWEVVKAVEDLEAGLSLTYPLPSFTEYRNAARLTTEYGPHDVTPEFVDGYSDPLNLAAAYFFASPDDIAVTGITAIQSQNYSADVGMGPTPELWHYVEVINYGPGTVTLQHLHSGSSVGSRFSLPGAAALVLQPLRSFRMIHEPGLFTPWVVLPAGGGGVASPGSTSVGRLAAWADAVGGSLSDTGIVASEVAAALTKLNGVEAGAQVTSFARVQSALGAATAAVALNSQRITAAGDPVDPQDVVTKAFLTAALAALGAPAGTVSGPALSTVGNLALWGDAGGDTLTDAGVALSALASKTYADGKASDALTAANAYTDEQIGGLDLSGTAPLTAYHGYTTGDVNPPGTTWTDFAPLTSVIVDAVTAGITRSGSSFTFSRAGSYLALVSLNAWPTAAYIGIRLRSGSTTLLQKFTYAGSSTSTSELTAFGVISVAQGESVLLQVVRAGSAGIWDSPETVDGDVARSGSFSFVRVVGSGGSGDVAGPEVSVADRIALFDGATGKLLKQSADSVQSLKEYTDASIAALSVAGGRWSTLLDLNLSQDAAFSFVDGAQTWHGLQWVGLNLASGADSFAVVPGTGLVLDNNGSASDWYLTTNTAPRIYLPLSQIPGYVHGKTRVRIWATMDNVGADANYEASKFGVETLPYAMNARRLWAWLKPQTTTPVVGCLIDSTEPPGKIAPASNHKVFCIEWSMDQVRFWSKAIATVAGQPNDAEFTPATLSYVANWKASSPGNGVLSDILAGSQSFGATNGDNLCVVLGAQTVNTSNSLVTTWSRLRIEYEL